MTTAPVAGNQYFTNVESLLGSLTQLNVANLKSGGDALVANNFSANGVVLNVTPNLTNLEAGTSITSAGGAADVGRNTYVYNVYGGDGGATDATYTLPVAEAGVSFVLIQAATSDTNGGNLVIQTNTPTTSGASQDVFATGNVVTTSNGTVLSAATSAADATTLTVVIGTTADAQLFDLGSRLVFTCVKTGEWNVNHEVHLGPEATATAIEGTLAFT
jgi:hypothetical protein